LRYISVQEPENPPALLARIGSPEFGTAITRLAMPRMTIMGESMEELFGVKKSCQFFANVGAAVYIPGMLGQTACIMSLCSHSTVGTSIVSMPRPMDDGE
jgi:hypothetical protein